MTLSQLASNSSHRRQICLLYKKSLRLAQDWYLSRPEFREKAVQIRIMFEQNRNVTNPKQVQELVKQTEWLLAEYHHPNPYIYPTAPGGSKYERNAPIPEEVLNRGVKIIDNN